MKPIYPTLSQEEFGALKTGLQSADHGRPWALGALPYVGTPMAIGQVFSGAKTEGLAGKVLGAKDTGILNSLTSATIGSDKSNTQQLINRIKTDLNLGENDRITNEHIQNWGIKNMPNLDLASVALKGYEGSGDPELPATPYNITQPFRTGSALRASGFTGKYDAPYITEYQGHAIPSGKTFRDMFQSGAFDDQIKTLDEFAGDKIPQTNIRDMKGYDPAFARAVSIRNMKESGSYISPNDEPSPSISFSDIADKVGSIFS